MTILLKITDNNYAYLAKNLIWLQYVLHPHSSPLINNYIY